MAREPKAAALVLSDAERAVLHCLIRRRGASQAAVMRARIVLAAGPGLPNHAVATQVGVSRQRVFTWPSHVLVHQLDGLVEAPRSRTPWQVGDEEVRATITRTLER